MKKTRLFITGISGTAGRALAHSALNENYHVGGTTYLNIPSELRGLIDQGLLKTYQVNLKKAAEINQAIQDFQPDVIIHLAGKVLGGTDKRVTDPSIYEENVLIFKNTLNATKKLSHLPRFILSSGCLVYNKQTSTDFITELPIGNLPKINPITQPYRASKAEQEKILTENDNLDYIIARPTQFTGPGKVPGVIEWFIASEILKIKTEGTNDIKVRNKLGEVDILDTRDVAKAFLALIDKGLTGEVYHISSGAPATVEIIAKTLLDISGLDSAKYSVTSTDIESETYFRFSPQKINNLGWKPQYNLKNTLTSYWEYFNNQKGKNEIL